MNRFIYYILLFHLSLNSCAQNNKKIAGVWNENEAINWKQMELRGRVKQITEIWFNIKDSAGTEIKFRHDSTIYRFNEIGNATQDYRYYSPKSIYNTILKYNSQGQMTEKLTLDEDSNFHNKTIFIYGKTGAIIEKYEYLKYDRHDNPIKILDDSSGLPQVDSSGYPRYITMYKLDEDGNKLVYTTKYEYDKDGNQAKRIVFEASSYNPLGSIAVMDTYKYDDNGNIIEEHKFIKGMKEVSSVTKYDNNNRWIEIKWFDDTKNLTSTLTGKLDDLGNIIEYVDITEKENYKRTDIYKYRYDKKQNWVEKQKFKKGILDYTIVRTIEYYD